MCSYSIASGDVDVVAVNDPFIETHYAVRASHDRLGRYLRWKMPMN